MARPAGRRRPAADRAPAADCSPSDRPGSGRAPAGGYGPGRGQPALADASGSSTVIESITTSSAGRSNRSVVVLAIASTTSRDAWSATSPKMVCRRFRCGCGPTVTKNWEPLVPGPGVGHGQQVGLVEGQLGVELVGELVAGATGAGAGRVAALDHEAGDHPVEDRPVVEGALGAARGVLGRVLRGALGQLDEVADGLGRLKPEELDPDVATVGVQGRVEVAHGAPSCHGGLCGRAHVVRRSQAEVGDRGGRPAAGP